MFQSSQFLGADEQWPQILRPAGDGEGAQNQAPNDRTRNGKVYLLKRWDFKHH